MIDSRPMRSRLVLFARRLVLVLSSCTLSLAAAAQVVTDIARDGSLTAPGIVDPTAPGSGLFLIEELPGERSGSNLFHSFDRFDLGAGDTARFTADPSQQTNNIINRVTGGSISNISGTWNPPCPVRISTS